MASLARRNLFDDKVRLTVTLTGIVFAVVLITVQLGLFAGAAFMGLIVGVGVVAQTIYATAIDHLREYAGQRIEPGLRVDSFIITRESASAESGSP